jgi:hypothetical protein
MYTLHIYIFKHTLKDAVHVVFEGGRSISPIFIIPYTGFSLDD